MLTALCVTTCVPGDPAGPQGHVEPDPYYADQLPQLDVYWLQFSGMETKRGRIIYDSAALRAAWDTVFAIYAPAQKPWIPAIDFNQNVVLLASAGPTPTRLLWFRITTVRDRPERLEVLVESVWSACSGSPVTTTPVHIVTVPRVSTQAVFEFIDSKEPCP